MRPQGTVYRVFVLAFCLSLAAAGALLTRLPSPPSASAVPAAMRLVTGSYVGDGADDRQIAGLGFQPDLVLVRSDGASPVILRTSTVAGDASKVLSEVTALQPDLVQSLDGAGFTVGADARVNGPGTTYYWTAMKAGSDLAVGSYVGDGTDNRSISGVGFQPVWVLSFADSKESFFRPSGVVGGGSYKIAGYSTLADRIQALEADGFQIGANGDVNQSGQTFHYVAWGASSQVSVGSYTGDGSDNRSITGVGLAPAFVWAKQADNSQATWRPASVAGDLSLNFNGASPGGNRIQALEADGFQVGTYPQVNTTGATYFYLALGDDVSPTTPTPTATDTAVAMETPTPTDTAVAAETPTPTEVPVDTPTPTETPTVTDTPTETPTPTPPVALSAMRLLTGSYVGDGVDDRQIAGLGFQPDLVLVRSDGTNPVIMRASTVPGDASKVLSEVTALQPDLVQSLDGDGFTLGTDARVNGPGTTYYWVAMKAGSDLAVGSYVGDGADNRSISGVGFQPVWVLTFVDSKDSLFRPSDLVGDASYKVAGYTTVANRLQALEADGFQIGSNGDVNQSGLTYHYVAWGASPQVSAGNYTGDGNDNRSVAGVGLSPAFVWVKGAASSQATWRPASVGGDRSLNFDAASPGNNRIQALEADGFQVGTVPQVNTAGATYFRLALRDDVGQPTPTPTSTATAGPTDTPTTTPTATATPGPAAFVPIFDDVSVAAGLRATDNNSMGVQWADYDNDGWLDFYVGRHGGNDPDLYHNRGDGTFENVGAQAGVRVQGDRHGCVWADITQDGFIDLMCAVYGPYHALVNQGDGTFANQATALGFGADTSPGSGRVVNAFDYNRDGRVDILYSDTSAIRIWRNLGGLFGIAQTYNELGSEGPKGSSTADYNGDGIADAFVANFPNTTWLLLRGTGTGLVDATAGAGLTLEGARTATWGDYDNDGDLDLFVTGYRHTCCSKPPKLFENQGNGTFTDVTSSAGINDGFPSRAGVWGDYNNDGWLDLFVVNGVRNDDGFNRPDQLYLNKGDKTFHEAASQAGIEGPTVGGGDSAAWADYDRDGDLDILVGNGTGELNCTETYVPQCWGPDKLYRNQGNSNHSLQLRLASYTDAYGYGTKVWITTSQGTQYREMTDGMIGYSQLPQVVHFGLGSSSTVDLLRIRWPDGFEETYSNVPANTSPQLIHEGTSGAPTPTATATPPGPPTATPTPVPVRPNLTVSIIESPPATASRGSSFQAVDTTKNIGDAPAGASTTRFYLSTDKLRSSGDRRLSGSRSIPALGPQEQSASGPAGTTVGVPSTTSTGTYYLLGCADDLGRVSEAYEGDNCRFAGSTITIQ